MPVKTKDPKPKTEIITIIKLKKLFDGWAPQVLTKNTHIELVEDRKRGAIRKYKINKPLPDAEAYRILRDKTFTIPLGDAVENAYSEFESLAEELDEWFNNLPESFQQGDKGSELENSRDSLQALDQQEAPEKIKAIGIVILPPLNSGGSRSDRCSEAAGVLREVAEKLGADEKETRAFLTAHSIEATDEEVQDIRDFAENISSAADEAEIVDFPGMY